jgi:hypothetical protein
MIRCLTRDLTATAAGVAASLTAAPVLLPLRSGWPDADVGLLLAVVVVAVAATGNRVAGGLAVAGAVWLKFSSPCPMSGSRSAARRTSRRLSCCWWWAWRCHSWQLAPAA